MVPQELEIQVVCGCGDVRGVLCEGGNDKSDIVGFIGVSQKMYGTEMNGG